MSVLDLGNTISDKLAKLLNAQARCDAIGSALASLEAAYSSEYGLPSSALSAKHAAAVAAFEALAPLVADMMEAAETFAAAARDLRAQAAGDNPPAVEEDFGGAC